MLTEETRIALACFGNFNNSLRHDPVKRLGAAKHAENHTRVIESLTHDLNCRGVEWGLLEWRNGDHSILPSVEWESRMSLRHQRRARVMTILGLIRPLQAVRKGTLRLVSRSRFTECIVYAARIGQRRAYAAVGRTQRGGRGC